MRLKILFIGHSHHKLTKSADFFIEHLNTIGDVSVEYDDHWKGGEITDYLPMARPFDMVVVWQLEPVISALASAGHPNLVFVPMYDSIHKIGAPFWRGLTRVKIICFSAALKATCLSHGLHSHFIQYYPETYLESPGGYATSRLFFWQRRPNPNWQTVTSILPPSQFEKLHHHVAIDPGFEDPSEFSTAPTPSEIRQNNFTQSTWFEKKGDLVAELSKSNLFFLPRDREGIGFSFLDAMAVGMIPLGFNFPTFNEYVIDGINGFILDKNQRLDLPPLSPVAANMQHYLRKGRINYERSLAQVEAFLLSPVPLPSQPLGFAILRKISPKLHRRLLKWKRAREILPITASRSRFQGESPLVTVVTVVRNNAPGLARTFQSVFNQTSNQFEYIVIDGNSTDDTTKLVKLHEKSMDHHLCENDQGPYDAMIKGAILARGRFIIYMNAGDEFAEATSLEDAMESCPDDAEFIYCHHYYVKNNGNAELCLARDLDVTYRKLKEGKLTQSWQRGIPCHQSSLVTRDLILKIGFDPDLIIAADHAFAYSACTQGAKTYHTNTVISKRYVRGLSSNKID